MSRPHTHDYYELYFLMEGTRDIFVENKIFRAEKNSFIIIPPFTMHKTEGGPFKRVNIMVSADLLSKEEVAFLTAAYKTTAFAIGKKYLDIIIKLLTDVSDAAVTSDKDQEVYMLSAARLILLLLSKQENHAITPLGVTHGANDSSDVLKIIQYLNENYTRQISLTDLCKHFFISKAGLCKKFKKAMYCSVMDYLLKIRLKRAQELLRKTKLSVDIIAAKCGFSSTNHFRNVFKQSFGISPLKYRKSLL